MGREPRDLAFRGLGAFLLSVPFLPLRRMFGPLEGAEALIPPGEWALGLAIFGVGAWLVTLAAGGRAPSLRGLTGRGLRRSGRISTVAACVAVAGLLVAASLGAFHWSPHLVDSVVQLFQAKIFASGELAAPPPPGGGFFATLHMIADASGWYSQYPPGHAALLAAGVPGGVPWAVTPVASLGSALLLFLTTRRLFGRACARLTLVLLALCPFFWFMGASFMNHVSTLFFVCLFLYLFVRWEQEGGAGWALAAGAALGAAALSRPLTAVAVTVPFTVFALRSERRGHVVVAAAGFAAVASLYLFYNAAVTGDPFLPGYLKLWGGSHGLGFHATPWGGEHTPLTGLRNELLDLSLLNLYLFEWPVPALLPVGAAFALGWTSKRWDRRLLAGFLAIPAAYFFYWHRDAFLGPRFLYSGVAFVIPLTARSLLEGGRRLQGRDLQAGDLFRPVDAGRWAAVFLLAAVGYGVFYGAPQRFRIYATGMPSMKTDIRREARDAGVSRGLVFVKVSWGNRILARLRSHGVPAALATKAYRNVGHCELEGMIGRVSRGAWSPERLTRALPSAISRDDSLVRTSRLNGDRTLRVRAGRPLAEACREEIRYDRSGYTNYTPHLVANSPDLSGPFVVARDLRSRNRMLLRRYPDRRAYIFDGDRFRALPDSLRGPRSRPGGGPPGDGVGRRPGSGSLLAGGQSR